jgi:DNA end-binding protein Ku
LTEDDFKKIDRKRTETIDVLDFVLESEIDTIYFEKPYFLEPDKGADKAYVLLRESLKKSKKVGVAKFVIHNREHLGIIKPHDHMIVLEQMRFKKEVQSPQELKIPEHADVRAKELTMATAFIDHLTEHFKPETYKDTYQKELEGMIKEKKKGHQPKPKDPAEAPHPSKSADIMVLLKESLEKAKYHHRAVV